MVMTEFNMDRYSSRIRLVDGGQGLLHVLRPPFIHGRHTDRDARGGSLADREVSSARRGGMSHQVS